MLPFVKKFREGTYGAAAVRYFWAAALLGVLSFATYSNSLHNEFMIDDHGLLLADAQMHNLKYLPQNFVLERTQEAASFKKVYYRPLGHALFMISYWLFKEDVFGYHLLNLILLYVCGLVLFAFLNMIFKDEKVSFLTAAFFCTHPINGMLVNYVTASYLTLQIIVILLGLVSFLRSEDLRRHNAYTYLTFLLFAAAVLLHETGIAFPFYLACVLFFVRKNSLKETAVKCIPFVVLLAAYFLLRLQYASLQDSILSKIPQFNVSLGVYIASLAKLVTWFLTKLVTLNGIVFIWATPAVKNNVVLWNAGFVIALATCVYAMFRKQTNPAVSFAFSWFFSGLALLSIACFFQPTVGFLIEPHWLPFSIIGILLMAAFLLVRLRGAVRKTLWQLLIVIIFASYILSSRYYNYLWGSEKRYCTYWLSTAPGFKNVMFYLANAHLKDKEYKEAEYFYKNALAGDVSDWQIYTNLGMIKYEEGYFDEALEYFNASLKVFPESAVTFNNLGLVFLKKNETQKAEQAFRRSIALNPYLLSTRLNMAYIYRQQWHMDAAVALYKENLEINPDDENSLSLLVDVYLQTARSKEALEIGKKFLKKNRDPKWLVNFGDLFAQNRFSNLAMAFYVKAIQANPLKADAYLEMGKLYGNRGQWVQAISVWQDGLRLNPQDGRFRALILEAQGLMEKTSPGK